MVRYKNLSGRSNVMFYEYGDDFIRVQFGDGSTYLYTNQSAGQPAIDSMKKLADTGTGLNSFIMKHVRKLYASRVR